MNTDELRFRHRLAESGMDYATFLLQPDWEMITIPKLGRKTYNYIQELKDEHGFPGERTSFEEAVRQYQVERWR